MTRLRVMTFNVRQLDADDGENAWEHRRELLAETVGEAAPDLVGTQELFTEQAAFLVDRLPRYRWFGAGRYGDGRDKHVGIFYRAEVVTPCESGTFWLSETPETAGSASWGIEKPRQVTWGLFEHRTGRRFAHFNAHFPYRREHDEARRRTADLILQRIAALPPGLPVLLTGDFNAPAGGEIHARLTGVLADAWLAAAAREGPEGTLNGFGRVSVSRRIDWILFRAPWRVERAATLARSRGGRFPSDHHPVQAEFDLEHSTEAIPT